MPIHSRAPILMLVIIVMCACAPAQQGAAVEAVAQRGSIEAIVFSDFNWPSAQVQNRIAQYIVEKGYGYPTDVVFGSTLPLFQGLRRGMSTSTWKYGCPTR